MRSYENGEKDLLDVVESTFKCWVYACTEVFSEKLTLNVVLIFHVILWVLPARVDACSDMRMPLNAFHALSMAAFTKCLDNVTCVCLSNTPLCCCCLISLNCCWKIWLLSDSSLIKVSCWVLYNRFMCGEVSSITVCHPLPESIIRKVRHITHVPQRIETDNCQLPLLNYAKKLSGILPKYILMCFSSSQWQPQ